MKEVTNLLLYYLHCVTERWQRYTTDSPRGLTVQRGRENIPTTNLIHQTWSRVKQQKDGQDKKHFRSWGIFAMESLHLLQSPVLFWLPWWLPSTEILYKDTQGWDLLLGGLYSKIPFLQGFYNFTVWACVFGIDLNNLPDCSQFCPTAATLVSSVNWRW